MGAHKDVVKAATWIIDEAETEESAAEVYGLDTTAMRLYYERPKDELSNQVASWSHVCSQGCAMSVPKMNQGT